MLKTQPIVVMSIIATDTKIRVFSLTIFFGYVILTKLTNNLFLKLFILSLIDSEMDNINRQAFLTRFIYNIILPELLRNIIFIVQEQRVELFIHELRLLLERNIISDIFRGENVRFANGTACDHNFIIVVNFSG